MGVDINVYRAAIGTFSNASKNISVNSFNQFQRRKQSVKTKTHRMIRWLKILVLLLWVGLSVETCQPCGETCDKNSLNIVQTFCTRDHRGKTFYSFTICLSSVTFSQGQKNLETVR